MTLRDENGDLVEEAALDSITVDLYRWAHNAPEVINGRAHQDVFGVNGGAFFDTIQTTQDEDGNDVTYNFRWNYEPDDTPFLKDDDAAPQQTEVHIAHFRFTWDSGTKAQAHEVRMTVTNFRRFPVLSP